MILSQMRRRLLLLGNCAVNYLNSGDLLVSRKACLRISKKAFVTIDSGYFYVGFQMRGGRRIPTFDHTTLVVHPGGRMETKGVVQLCAGSCMSVYTGAFCSLGNGVIFSPNSIISCIHGLSIGCNSVFGWGLTLHDDDFHQIKYSTDEERIAKSDQRRSIQIGADVWVGHSTTILKGVTIGNGAIIGAGSVVTKNVASNTMVAGNPARVIRQGVSWSW